MFEFREAEKEVGNKQTNWDIYSTEGKSQENQKKPIFDQQLTFL